MSKRFIKRQSPIKDPQQMGIVVERSAAKKLQQLAQELEVSKAEVFEFMMETADSGGFMRVKRISAITARLQEIHNIDGGLRNEERKLIEELKKLKNSDDQTGDNE